MIKPKREILYNLYIVKNITIHEIGNIYNCNDKTVCEWLEEDNIPIHGSSFNNNELNIIKDYYENHIDKLNLDELCFKLGRPRVSVCGRAGRMGLTNRKRGNYYTKEKLDFIDILFLMDNQKNMSYKTLEKHLHISEPTIRKYLKKLSIYEDRNKDKWKRSEHPKGMLGKNHTIEVCNMMSNNLKRRWEDPNDFFNSDECRQKKSDDLTDYHKIHVINTPYSRCHGGKRDDIGNQYFRSSWEANFARYLNYLKDNNDIFDWLYEEDRFEFIEIKRGIRSYMPDFKVWNTKNSIPYYYEVKGWMDDSSKIKIKLMKKYYPEIKLIIIDEKKYKIIKNLYFLYYRI
jgi:hypothetical protein